ncbi:MAG: hypothetical protein IPI90_06780 [Saprospiraceae bacterium]|nr:hypothetical protein [Candidatus Vicinibacter affinis]
MKTLINQSMETFIKVFETRQYFSIVTLLWYFNRRSLNKNTKSTFYVNNISFKTLDYPFEISHFLLDDYAMEFDRKKYSLVIINGNIFHSNNITSKTIQTYEFSAEILIKDIGIGDESVWCVVGLHIISYIPNHRSLTLKIDQVNIDAKMSKLTREFLFMRSTKFAEYYLYGKINHPRYKKDEIIWSF